MKPKLYSRRTKTSTSPLCCIQADRFSEGSLFTSCDDHLGDTVAVMNAYVLLSMVYQKYRDFATVISIDGAGTVEHSQAMLGSQSASRSHLSLVPGRQLNAQACGYLGIAAAANHHILFKTGTQVCAGAACSTIDRKQCFRSQLDYRHRDRNSFHLTSTSPRLHRCS